MGPQASPISPYNGQWRRRPPTGVGPDGDGGRKATCCYRDTRSAPRRLSHYINTYNRNLCPESSKTLARVAADQYFTLPPPLYPLLSLCLAMAQSLELLLIQFLMPDNDARRQAEEQIKRLAKDPQVVPALIQHLRTAKTPNVRQLAAVLLRKKITGHWAKLPPQTKQLVKDSLIESITLEHR